MLRYLYADQLGDYPHLAQSMFRDRAMQFRTRMGWDVKVDENGEERDQYDAMNPLYVIWQNPDGGHGGSMRFLPTTGRVMVNDVFQHLTGAAVSSPLIWECTRFCIGAGGGTRVAAALMLGGGELMTGFGIRHLVGVFDARMERIYRAIGSSPEVLGSDGTGRDRISVGLWNFTLAARARVSARAGVSLSLSRLRFDRAFGPASAPPFSYAA
ncbi:MAG: autoinducer synthase [Marinibacterium sp.]|nr:autoinducer synthase [Marinibacterium sp.]